MPGFKHPRVLFLPSKGKLLVNTDLHGNGDDFRRLRGLFLDLTSREPQTHWVILGDIVHGPNAQIRAYKPTLYDYEDESWPIAQGIVELRRRFPGRVHYVLGNHDYAHIGGPITSKFYPDEAAHLEAGLAEDQRAELHRLFREALLAVVAPCGLFLTHGSPSDTLRRLEDLNDIPLPPDPADVYGETVVTSFLTCYGQRGEVAQRLLQTVSRSGPQVCLVVHGHDKDEKGYFTEGGNQLCPVIFGAPRANKRYLVFDLAACYRSLADVREGQEIRRLHEAS
jgi:hypothetical protein